MVTWARRARRVVPDVGRWGLVAVVAISLFPIVRMLRLVRSGTHVQYDDYWYVIDANFSENGWLRADRFLDFDYAHLLAVPKLVYWLNIRLFAGSNIALGHLVILIVIGQVLLLWHLLPRRDAVATPLIATLAVAVPMLLFAPHGAWNFMKAMSGTAWLLANLVTLAAVVAAWRGHKVTAGVLAVVAPITYGTGLTAWVAVLVVSLLRDRRVRSHLPSAGAAAVTYLAYALLYTPYDPVKAPPPGPPAVIANTAALVGSLFVEDRSIAVWLGGAALVALAAFAVICIVHRTPGAPPWIGIGAASVASALLIGFQRDAFGSMASRYSSIAALIWLSMMVLGSLTVRPRALPIVGVAALSLWLALAGTVHDDRKRVNHSAQAELANALRMGVATDRPMILLDPFPELTPRLRTMGHYPFSDAYDADCGLLGTTLGDGDTAEPGADEVDGTTTDAAPHPGYPRAVGLRGSVDHPDLSPTCIVVTDDERRVVGVGVLTESDAPADGPEPVAGAPGASARTRTNFTALAPRGSSVNDVWVAFSGSDLLHPVRSP